MNARRAALPSPAEQALAAFGDALAVFGAAAQGERSLQWCSPGLRARWGALAQQTSWRAWTARLGGLAAGAAVAETEGAWSGPIGAGADGAADGGAVGQAQLRALPDGALALRLLPEPEQQRATRRHLEDRERLLFTSRSVAVGEMATTLAHELNQPLGAVTNVLRGLKARLAAAALQPQPGSLRMLEQGVQLALDQVQYAARIIGRIRDYTQSRQPRREQVDVNALLHNSLTLLDWDLERHGVQLRIARASGTEGATPVVGDGVMLQQVMVNLLRNGIDAMAATPAGERRLTIESRIDDAGQLEITIADTGIGIGEEGAAQLFMPFYSTKPNGMGIGLNICRSLIELHQGRLWFTPNAPRGCVFHVALPLADAAEAERLPRFLDAQETVT